MWDACGLRGAGSGHAPRPLMRQMTTTARRLWWHGAAGLGMGGACTIATVPFSSGLSAEDVAVAASLLACSTALSCLVALATAGMPSDRGAAVVTGFLAPLAGIANAVACYALSRALRGLDPTADL